MPTQRFFEDEDFEFAALIALGAAPYRMAEVGEVYATTDRITGGDYDSWFDAWTATAERVRAAAEEAERHDHEASACDAYLRAAHYLGVAFFFVLGTSDPSRSLATWRRHRDCFDRAMRVWPTPVEAIEIPYEDTALQGYFFRAADAERPLLVLTNGSDGPVSDMIEMGAADAVARGWHALVFDGPGQGQALYEQGLTFRHDWEAVITPVLDYALDRTDVDPDKVVLSGNSQGGYWVPRAAAFEHRLAAAVADPGVVDVRTSWTAHLPDELLQMVDAGQDEQFDEIMAEAMKSDAHARFTLSKRMEPYGTDSFSTVLHELERWNLHDVAGEIACPLLVTDPDDEQFWPGQPQQLYDLVTHPGRELVRFTAEEGANWHCEPLAPQLRGQRIFDWITHTV